MTLDDLLRPGAPLLLSEREAASVLGLSPSTLCRSALAGTSRVPFVRVTDHKRLYSTVVLLSMLGLPTGHLTDRRRRAA